MYKANLLVILSNIGNCIPLLILVCLLTQYGQAQSSYNIYEYYIAKGINYDTINRYDSLRNPHGFWIILNKDRKPKAAGYTDAQIVEQGNYDHGKKSGVWTTFYPEGSKKDELTLVNGKPNGPAISYYSNGKTKEKRNWNGPKTRGELIIYDEKGNVTYKGMFNENGKPVNIEHYTDGVKSSENKRINDSTEVVTEFDKSGKIIKKSTKPIVKEKSRSKY
jgi:hypothetical protein